MKPSLMIISVFFFLFLLCVATSTAALTTSNEKVYSRLRQHSMFYRALTMLSNAYTDSTQSIEADENDDVPVPDQIEDVLLPETNNVDGVVTPDDGNAPVNPSDDSADSPNIDVDGTQGQTLQDSLWTVDEPGVDEVASDVVVVDNGETDIRINKVVENFISCNGEIGTLFKPIIERIYASGTGPGGTATPVVSNVVLETTE